jgi:hypothetical protein
LDGGAGRPGMACDWVSDGPRVVGQGVVGDWIGIETEGNLDDWADGE